MPGEFLTDAQEQTYGHFYGPPSNQPMSRYFHFDDADRELVNMRRGAPAGGRGGTAEQTVAYAESGLASGLATA
jgi:hypothetical protein